MRICCIPQDAFTTSLQIVKYLPTHTHRHTQNSSWPVEKHNPTPVRCSDSAVGSDHYWTWHEGNHCPLTIGTNSDLTLQLIVQPLCGSHILPNTPARAVYTHYPIQHTPAQAQWMTWLCKSDKPKSCSMYARALNLDVGISFSPVRLKGSYCLSFVFVRFWCILWNLYKYITPNVLSEGQK